MTPSSHPLIGLTGGIGSGKSTVANLFAQLGARIIDTDLLSHQLTAPSGSAMQAIREQFGDGFIQTNGALDRPKMRQHVFSSTTEKQKLESLLHPLILGLTKQIAFTANDAPYTLVVVPLLFENPDYRPWLTRTLLVDCPESLQLQRTMQRSHLTEKAVLAIMAQQLPRSERIGLADDIIHNTGRLENLRKQIDTFHSAYLALSGK